MDNFTLFVEGSAVNRVGLLTGMGMKAPLPTGKPVGAGCGGWVGAWAVVATVMLLLPLAVLAGTVETQQGRSEGKVLLGADGVTVAGKPVPWAEVLYVLADPAGSTLPRPNLVRLRTGEVLAGQILTSTGKQIEVRCDWFGKRPVEMDQVAVIEFLANVPVRAALKRQTLYREKGEPVPGVLMWLEKDTLGLDSPLGSTTVKREGLVRYVFDDKPPAPSSQDHDEVGLIDGSIFRGKIEPEKDGLRMEHSLLGKMSLPATAVRFVVRHTASAVDVSELVPLVQETGEGILAKGRVVPSTVSPASFAPAGDAAGVIRAGGGCAKVVRIEPKITLRYTLPKHEGRKLVWRTSLAPVDGARGDTQIKVSVGGKAVLEKSLAASDRPSAVNLDLPRGDDLTIEVDFGTLLRFPCGVLLLAPRFVLTK
jgi:hypothetical protein